ncbi:adenosylcobinamide kinase/adenosylcobinamide phosphate guanyltransferase [Paenibacillus sp. 598K]|uniref:bifunctional adenosylcobinamide kinase/adenosylcobinamide-phosphate guanylyltransferase n=1 Tax=Paenibacillus sp. 598K TaxID=1117987 RepID=UPI000FF9D546|nr:bifunctional adenosylcobinamide kinase/adenosylcobinamide-phosphate guanylyltransferase [Paenibacillus sp. 598K]GBF78406.1 adenosylcobinamide kinase/adenosylcobinamide phosphate guanyltransferase [Paenibacillus sp. 598K]
MTILITGGARSGKSDFAEAAAARLADSGVYVATLEPLDEEMQERLKLHRQQRAASGFDWRTIEEPHDLTDRLRELATGAGYEAARMGGSAADVGRAAAQESKLASDDGQVGPRLRDSDTEAELAADRLRLSGTGLGRASVPELRPPVVLVDCLTLWLTNRMLALEGAGGAWGEAEAAALAAETEQLIELCSSYPLPLLLVTNEVGGGLVPEYPLGRRFRDEAGRLNRRLAAVCERVYLVTAGIPVELKSIAARLDEL